MIDLSIIIISYNTRQITLECIKSILDSVKDISYEVIVVDNNSSDESVELIQNSKFIPIQSGQNDSSKFKIIRNEKNEGFSKANNIGIKESRGRYILFLNSDTVVYPNTLEKMVEFMDKNSDAGAATCKVVLPNGEIDDAAHRGFPTPVNSIFYFSGMSKIFPRSKMFAGYNLGYMNLESIHEIDACAGAFMMVRREAGEKIGWWDEDFFWYGEDIDFCFRLKKMGYKIYYVPEVKVLHYKGVSGGIKKISKNISSADKKTQKMAQKARFDAMRIFYKKHYKNIYPWYINRLIFSGISLRERLASF